MWSWRADMRGPTVGAEVKYWISTDGQQVSEHNFGSFTSKSEPTDSQRHSIHFDQPQKAGI
jgi:hypothetical protein